MATREPKVRRSASASLQARSSVTATIPKSFQRISRDRIHDFVGLLSAPDLRERRKRMLSLDGIRWTVEPIDPTSEYGSKVWLDAWTRIEAHAVWKALLDLTEFSRAFAQFRNLETKLKQNERPHARFQFARIAGGGLASYFAREKAGGRLKVPTAELRRQALGRVKLLLVSLTAGVSLQDGTDQLQLVELLGRFKLELSSPQHARELKRRDPTINSRETIGYVARELQQHLGEQFGNRIRRLAMSTASAIGAPTDPRTIERIVDRALSTRNLK